MSASHGESDRSRKPALLPTRRGLWVVVAAIAAGVLLFLLTWMGGRDAGTAQVPDAGTQASPDEAFKPLPAPPPAGGHSAGPLPATPEPPPRASSSDPTARGPAADAARPPPVTAAVELSASAPVPIDMPPPRYPSRALRRGEAGEVLLRVQVDARGVPSSVEVVSGSGSRDLDRAAINAARRWRFRPAMRDGQPMAGVVNVPITFDSRR